MTDADALLAAIRAAPDDDAPRLIYADWLDEHGQPERAEFIRVQCELARKESAILRQREAELLAAKNAELAGRYTIARVQFKFSRGFVAGFGHSGVFISASDRQAVAGHILRFYPDGTVIQSVLLGDTADISAWFQRTHEYSLHSWFQRGNEQANHCRYKVDGDAGPECVWFWYTGSGSRYRGCLTGSTVLLGKEGRMDDPRFTDRYEQVHHDDFHSFPET